MFILKYISRETHKKTYSVHHENGKVFVYFLIANLTKLGLLFAYISWFKFHLFWHMNILKFLVP